MGWVAPTNVATGDVLTAAGWNQAVVANEQALYAIMANVQSVHKTSTWQAALSGSYQDVTGLSATITPTLATSKVLVTATVLASTTVTTASMLTGRVWRGSSATVLPFVAAATQQSANTNWFLLHIQYLDSPATTAATTYQFQIAGSNGGTNYTYVNLRGDATSTQATSSFTLQEIPV